MILTGDGALAGALMPHLYAKAVSGTLVAGRAHSSWYQAGIPGVGVADTATNGGVARSSTSALVQGQIPFYNPVSGYSYLHRMTAQAAQSGMLLLCDRLWDCGNANGSTLSVTSTSAQTINSAAFPARDLDGSANGRGVFLAVEVSSGLGAGTPTWTLTYTNSGNTGSRTGTNIVSVVASSIAGTFHIIRLDAGDVGVRSVQTFQSSATATSGQFVLVAFRVLAAIELTANLSNGIDFLTGGFTRLYDGAVPFLVFVPSTTTTTNLTGLVHYSQG